MRRARATFILSAAILVVTAGTGWTGMSEVRMRWG